jgi:uncharacterized protein
MPSPRRSPSFIVVSLVVTALAIFGFGAKRLERIIPRASSQGPSVQSDFFRQSRGSIQWRQMTPETLAEARRSDKPILLYVGVPWSLTGRELDQEAFTDPEIQSYIIRHFVPVRIDADQRPHWLSVYLPLARGRPELGQLPYGQLWLLDSDGRMFETIARRSSWSIANPTSLLNDLARAVHNLDRFRRDDLNVAPPGAGQLAELQALRDAIPTTPDFSTYERLLVERISEAHGGIPSRTIQQHWPQALRFLLLQGNHSAVRSMVDPMLRTPIVDWLDGGLFLKSYSVDWKAVVFDKSAIVNAEMMEALAMAAFATGDNYYDFIAKRTFDSLAGEFMQGGLVRAARIGDEGRLSRSRRSSFPPRIMREAMPTNEDRIWARNNLGLRVETNPRMSVMVDDPTAVEDPHFDRILDLLRGHAGQRDPRFTGEAMLDVNGTVAAKMLACARLWNDERRLAQAVALFEAVQAFRTPGGLVHSIRPWNADYVYLGDYMAYADAALQDYLATGRILSLEDGLRMLLLAVELFESEFRGLLSLIELPGSGEAPPDTVFPEVLDFLGEAASAKAIRLLHAYGVIHTNYQWPEDAVQKADGQDLVGKARSGATSLPGLLVQMPPRASAYFANASEVLEDTVAFVVGPDAQRQADILVRRVPTRLVVPAFGRIRPDLQQRGPGIYIVRESRVQGPMPLAQATEALRQR